MPQSCAYDHDISHAGSRRLAVEDAARMALGDFEDDDAVRQVASTQTPRQGPAGAAVLGISYSLLIIAWLVA